MKRLTRNSGQFIPISAMVMFTMVVSLVAVVNMYRIARAKVQAQGLADAIALAIATQEARMLNLITDRNEWLNHMATADGASTTNLGNYSNSSSVALQWLATFRSVTNTGTYQAGLGNPGSADPTAFTQTVAPICSPPLSFAENTTAGPSQGFIFCSQKDLMAYATLVHTINLAQEQFSQYYNGVLGVPGFGSGKNFNDILNQEVPTLQTDKSIVGLTPFNSDQGAQAAQSQTSSMNNGSGQVNTGLMQQIVFTPHNIQAQYFDNAKSLLSTKCCFIKSEDFGTAATEPNGVGWMQLNWANSPKIQVAGANPMLGGGVVLKKSVNLGVLGTYPITVTSKAVVVEGSGVIPGDDPRYPGGYTHAYVSPNDPPVFSPTYWVKLVQP